MISVCERRCFTCVFGDNTPISAERFAMLEESWSALGRESAQVCHATHTGTGSSESKGVEFEPEDDDDGELPLRLFGHPTAAICRGYWSAAKEGRYTLPAGVQVAERLQLIRFVSPEST